MLLAPLDGFLETATVGELGRFVQIDDGLGRRIGLRRESGRGDRGRGSGPRDRNPRGRRADAESAGPNVAFGLPLPQARRPPLRNANANGA